MVYIASVGTYEGPLIPQSDHINRVRNIHGPILDKVSRDPMIHTRQLHEYDGDHSLESKQRAIRSRCLAMAIEAVTKAIERWDGTVDSITHIIMCTSTEYMAPSLEMRIMSELKMDPSIMRVPIVMAGCAAGGLALQMAYHIVKADPTSNVLVVATECVSPHLYRPSTFTIDTAISTTIFSDGAGALIVSSTGRYRISSPTSYTIPSTLKEMEIEPRDGGIHVALSKKIHTFTSEHVMPMVHRMMDGKPDGYILHPGGKSILNAIATKIDGPIISSWDILSKYGNTSSSAIIYVLDHAWDTLPKGRFPIITFGQGIHVAGILLEH